MKSYDIALVPSRTITERSIVASRALRQYGGVFVLNNNTERPHVSLYIVALPPGSLRVVRDRLVTIARRTSSIKLNAHIYHQSEDGWIDVEYHRTQALCALQHEIIAAVNPIRDGIIRDHDRARLVTASTAHRRNINRFGYRFVGAAFRPHITLTKLKDPHTRIHARDNAEEFSCISYALGLFSLGMHGTCVRLLATFPFV